MSLQKFPGSDLNDISKKVQAYLDKNKLKPNGIAKFRLLGGVKNIDPNKKKTDPEIFYSASKTISLTDRIIDPGDKEDGSQSKVVHIGSVRYIDEKSKNPVFNKYVIVPDGTPIFTVRANVVKELNDYDFLLLSNANASNPFRDKSVPPIFEMVNDAAEASERSGKRSTLYDCLSAIRHWTRTEMQTIAAAYNINTDQETSVLKDRLEELAEKAPAEFYAKIDSEDTKVRAVIKLAIDAGIIAYSAHEHNYKMVESEAIIATLERRDGVEHTQQFVEFLNSAANGPAVLGSIQDALKKKK